MRDPSRPEKQNPPGLTHSILPNGLEVFIYESHKAPLAIASLWVRCGSNNEPDHLLGWSHGVEHMVFQGTARRPGGAAAREVKQAGGELNAGTSYDMTNYYIMVPRDKLALALDIQSDYIGNALFEPEALDNEREVIIEEMKMYEDQPAGFGRSWDELLKLAYRKSNYRRRIIGTESCLRKATREEILAFKNDYYTPNNMALIIAGDVRPAAALALAKKYYGRLQQKKFKPLVSPPEPAQTKFRCRVIHGEVNRAYVKIGFHIPGVEAPAYYGIMILLHVLTEGRSARLYTGLKEKKGLVHSVAPLHEIGRGLGYAGVEMVCDPENVPGAAEELLVEIDRLSREPVSMSEVETALTMMEKDYHFQLETVEGVSSLLGQHWSWGDHHRGFEYLEGINAVRPPDILKIAEDHFYPAGASMLTYLPRDVEMDENALADRLMTAKGLSDRKKAAKKKVRRSPKKEKIRRKLLPGGIPFVYLVDRELPIVTVGALMRGGNYFERPAANGISRFTLNAMLKGTDTRPMEKLARDLEILGSTIMPLIQSDFISFFITTLKRNLPETIRLLSEILRSPSFPERGVARERENTLSSIKQVEDDTFQYAFLELKKKVFGSHPYGMPLMGTRETVKKMKRKDLVRWHRAFCGTENLGFSIVGDMDPGEVEALLEKETRLLAGTRRPEPGSRKAIETPLGLRFKVQKDVQQAVIITGLPGPKVSSADYIPMRVLEQSLSGMAGRLFTELRDRQGLCYYTSFMYSPFKKSGLIGAFIGTSPDKVDTAEKGLVAELEKIRAKGISAGEVALAKNSLIGAFTIETQSTVSRAVLNGRNEMLDLGYNGAETYVKRVKQVKREDVLRVAKKYLHLGHAITVVLTP